MDLNKFKLSRLSETRRMKKGRLPKWSLHVALFIATVFTTTLIGGPWYALTLMLILFCHEMGHYVAARHYGVKATLPYFIPFPNLFGTMGAVIRMQGQIPNRRALFDIGIMGPAAGIVIALPATVIGIALSNVVALDNAAISNIALGDSLLFSAITRLIHGDIPEGYDLLLHPIGFAGWAGLFVTALNLLPIGQLDGGHIVYAIAHKKSAAIYRTIFVVFALVTFFVDRVWLLFLVLILFLVRLKHPPTMNDELPIGKTRLRAGIAALIFFALTFPPVPIKING